MKTGWLIFGFDGIEDLGIIGVLVGAMERNSGRAVALGFPVCRFDHIDRCAYVVLGLFARRDNVDCNQVFGCIVQRCNRCKHVCRLGVGEHIAHIALAEIAQHTLTLAILIVV